MNNGIYVKGNLVGYFEESWKNDNGVNRQLVISQPYQDRYGNDQCNVIKVDVANDIVDQVKQVSQELATHEVMLRVTIRAVPWNGKAFLSYFMPKDSIIQPVSKS